MGNSKPKPQPPQEKPKTMKDLAKEFDKGIRKQQREFQREIMNLQNKNKTITKQVENMVKKGENKNSTRLIAQNIIKNNIYMQKYQRLDAQLSDITFQINQAATAETMVQVLTGITGMLKMQNTSIDVKNINQTMEQFNRAMEENQLMNELIEDALGEDNEDISDVETDKLINEIEVKVNNKAGGTGKQQLKPQVQNVNNDFNDMEDRLNSIK